jgi:ketosteroid isomerase-like protein
VLSRKPAAPALAAGPAPYSIAGDTARAMSQENVEVVRRWYEHFDQTGEPDYCLLDPEVVYDVSRRTFDSNVYRGHEGVRRFASLIREQWATLRIEPKEFRAAGNEVVVSVRLIGVGRMSGVETTPWARANQWS